MASEGETQKLITDRNAMRQRLDGFEKARARITKWHIDIKNPFVDDSETRRVLRKVLDIFDEEVKE